jgi:hypothetical protein
MTHNEGNKLIVEFMGWTIEPGMEKLTDPFYNQPYKAGYIPNMVLLSNLPYRTSWNWLMPVVEKIEEPGNFPDGSIKEGASVYINYKNCRIEYSDDDRMYDKSPKGERGETKIESVWKAVIQFIKWYNTQTK